MIDESRTTVSTADVLKRDQKSARPTKAILFKHPPKLYITKDKGGRKERYLKEILSTVPQAVSVFQRPSPKPSGGHPRRQAAYWQIVNR